MSHQKTTISLSSVNILIEFCLISKIPYEVKTLEVVQGMGHNDWKYDESGEYLIVSYEIRVFRTGRVVVYEQFEQLPQSDADDYIKSYLYSISDEPKEWEPVIYPYSEEAWEELESGEGL